MYIYKVLFVQGSLLTYFDYNSFDSYMFRFIGNKCTTNFSSALTRFLFNFWLPILNVYNSVHILSRRADINENFNNCGGGISKHTRNDDLLSWDRLAVKIAVSPLQYATRINSYAIDSHLHMPKLKFKKNTTRNVIFIQFTWRPSTSSTISLYI